jgi:hypothetical protein
MCPCCDSKGGLRKSITTIRDHLRRLGRDKFLYHSMLGEDLVDGFPGGGIWISRRDHMSRQENDSNAAHAEDDFADCETMNFLDVEHDIQQQVFDALNRADTLNEEAIRDTENNPEYEGEVPNMNDLEKLYRQASIPVWQTGGYVSSVSVISAIVVIMTMCTTHGVSNAFADELLRYLSTSVLPKGNCLPNSFYHAKNSIRKMGLEYSVIHCCLDGHVLFRGDLADRDSCPHPGCGKSRWIAGSTSMPAKVVRHFPFIPRLKRLYRSPAIAKLLRWAAENKMGTDEMKSVVDSPAWNHMDTEIDRDFGMESRNLRLGMSLDGVNPFSMQRSAHSTWPVMVLVYNLPPWLVTKKFFVILCILISGKESPTSENIDIYLSPLVDELRELWEGVEVFDAGTNITI